jgi:hypothetical protein
VSIRRAHVTHPDDGLSKTPVVLRNWKTRAVEVATMLPVLALSDQTGVTLAEVDFSLRGEEAS